MATTSIWSASPINVTKSENAEVRTNYVKALKYKLSKSPCTYASEKLVLDPWKKWYGPHNVDRLHGSHEEWAKDQAWKVAFAIHILGFGPIFLLYFCEWNQRNYDTSCRRNQETGVDHFFWRGVRGFEPDVMIPNKNKKQKQKKTKQNTRLQDLKQHHTLSLHRQKCQVRTPFLTGPCPIFLSRKRAFISFCFS